MKTQTEDFIEIMGKIFKACKKNRKLLTDVPWNYGVWNDEQRVYTAESLEILTANHLFDDFPKIFGITQKEGWDVRGYIQTDAGREDYEFVKELHEAFPDMLNDEREEYITEINEKRAKKGLPKLFFNSPKS